MGVVRERGRGVGVIELSVSHVDVSTCSLVLKSGSGGAP